MPSGRPGQRASGGALRGPARLRHPDDVGLEEAPHALRGPELSDQVLGAERPPDRGQGLPVDDRAAKWATEQVGGGRTVSEVAGELSVTGTRSTTPSSPTEKPCSADRKRLNKTSAIGLDDTSSSALDQEADQLCHHGRRRGEPPDHRDPPDPQIRGCSRLDRRPTPAWKERIRFGALDMSNLYAAVYSVTLPMASQVVDPFHLVQLANRSLDGVRRRVQSEQTGHRGRRDDPLYRARRMLLRGEERLDEKATERCWPRCWRWATRGPRWPLRTG